MAGPSRKSRISPRFNLGGESAEADSLLERAFYPTNQYVTAESRAQRDCFLIGRTGAGKSAILQRLEEAQSGHVIRLNPEDISLPYITAIDVFRYLDSLDVNLDLLWIALWKHVILIQILKHRYNVDSVEARKNVIDTLRSAISRDSAKKLALDYLETFDGKFWAETDESVRQITDGFEKKIAGELGLQASVPGVKASGKLSRETNLSREEKIELSSRFQSVVNDTQLPRLNKLIEMLNDDILDSGQNFTYVVIDDLDRDWVDDRLTNSLIRCLMRATLDFQRVKNLKVLVALRTNIYEGVDFGNRGGGQEEKIRALVIPLTWDKKSLTALLNERVKVASAETDSTFQSASEMLPHSNSARGNPLEYILDRTLLRPRDAIAFFKECIRQAENKAQISWDNIVQAEKVYSRNRLLALRDEWKGNYPGIAQVFEAFQGASGRMSREEIADVFESVVLKLADESFEGADWLSAISEPVLSGKADLTWEHRHGAALNLLYRLGFLGASNKSSDRPVLYTEDSHLMATADGIRDLKWFVVNRTYQAALNIKTALASANM